MIRADSDMKKNYSIKTDDRGVAMMVCITIIAILMIFCFSLLAVSYSLYSSQNNTMQEERNAEAAKSLSMAIREELTADSEDSLLVKYLRYNIVTGADAEKNEEESWPHYEPGVTGHDEESAKRYFKLQKSDAVSINGVPSSTEICMWWTAPETEINPDEDAHLFVEVECRSGSQSYVVCSEYKLMEFDDEVCSYAANSEQVSINPAHRFIDRNFIWRWEFVGSR